jgi:hypothetical protein
VLARGRIERAHSLDTRPSDGLVVGRDAHKRPTKGAVAGMGQHVKSGGGLCRDRTRLELHQLDGTEEMREGGQLAAHVNARHHIASAQYADRTFTAGMESQIRGGSR